MRNEANSSIVSYHPQLKTTISLKDQVDNEADQDHYEVDLILHEHPNVTSAQLATFVASAAGVPMDDLEILPRKIRLTVHQDKLKDLAALDSVNRIEEVEEYAMYNDHARATLLDVSAIHGASISYQGTGQIVCVADSGFDQGFAADAGDVKIHPAFINRVVQIMRMVPETELPHDPVGHGTHVCASICGNGVYKNTTDAVDVPIQGTAPNARVVVQAMSKLDPFYGWILKPPSDTSALYSSAHELGVRIHNNSWGKKYKPAKGQLGYEADATAIDLFIGKHLDFCILVAAGNDAQLVDPPGSQIGANASAKNCITVGATGTTRDNDGQRFTHGKHEHALDISSVASFSSRGPTLPGRDAKGQLVVGRIKPDVVAPGVAILSAASRALPKEKYTRVANGVSDDPDWMFQSGTSMSTPLVAGCVALLREALHAVGKAKISAALIKALLINGAILHGNAGAAQGHSIFDYAQGFGLVNVAASLTMVQQLSFVDGWRGKMDAISEAPHSQDVPPLRVTLEAEKAWQSPPLVVPSTGIRTRLTVTLTYPDPPGALLQNDVNLIVRAGVEGAIERHGNMADGEVGFDLVSKSIHQ